MNETVYELSSGAKISSVRRVQPPCDGGAGEFLNEIRVPGRTVWTAMSAEDRLNLSMEGDVLYFELAEQALHLGQAGEIYAGALAEGYELGGDVAVAAERGDIDVWFMHVVDTDRRIRALDLALKLESEGRPVTFKASYQGVVERLAARGQAPASVV